MREIKFRAWIGIKMEYQVLVGQLGNFFAYQDPKDTACAINTKYPESVPVMQYTGLKDRNGKEIYEGDIVRLFEWQNNPDVYKIHPNLFLVDDCENHAKFHLYSPDELWGRDKFGKLRETDAGIELFMDFNPEEDEYEVVGNIYENPDLMVIHTK